MPALTPDRWREISPYLDQALSLSENERAEWLTSLAEQSPELVQMLRNLLEEHRALAQERFLEGRPVHATSDLSLVGETIGCYRLISLIGQGGMGSVWLAERSDGRFDRRVAIKFLNFSVSAQGGAQRFKREGKILGKLAHPHIAELIDAGVTPKGEPYLVLEHVDGEHIDQYCDKHKLTVEARINLFQDVLSAVAHAHANLIVHRDIKPSNVLVRKDGQIKLLDFGIAKLLVDDENPASATVLTLEGGSALTPQFASPEQVSGRAITTATDVYALGVLLYMLMTGQHPAGSGPHSPVTLIKAIAETDPPRASDVVKVVEDSVLAENRATVRDKLCRQLRGDLDTIIGKALKKNPQERYSSVTALADDLRRYLQHEPISARPDTLAYRTAKFIRRNRTALALATLACVAVIAGITGTLIQARTAGRQRDFAFRQLARAEKVNDLNHFLLTDADVGKPLTVDELLERAERIIKRENYSQDPAGHVEMLVSIGSQYCDKEQYDKSLPVLQEAYQLSRGLQDPSARAQASCALARPLYRGRAEYARAESLVQEGLRELPSDPQFALERAFCLATGGDVASWSGAGTEGLARHEAAQQILEKSHFASDYLRLNVLQDLADDYHSFGEIDKTTATYERVSVLLTNLGYDQTQLETELFRDWGLTLIHAGRAYEAEKILHRGLDVWGTTKQESVDDPILLNSYAIALRLLERTDEATAYAKRAYARAQQINDKLIAEQCLVTLAQCYRQGQDLVHAAAIISQVEPLERRDFVPGAFSLTILESEKSLLAQAQGDLPRALRLADQVVSTAEAGIKAGRGEGELMYLPILLARRSSIELEAQRPDKARADAERALSLLLKRGAGTFSIYTGWAYMALGRALLVQDKSDEARAAFRSAAEQLEHAAGPDHPETRIARQFAGASPQ